MTRLERIQIAIEKGITCNPETGEVFGIKGGVIKRISKGYYTIGFNYNKKIYQLSTHQFIWYWVNKEIVEQIDHIDGNPLNNSISNLRAVDHQQNQFNRTKAKGYTYCNKGRKYQSSICKSGKKIHLGVFDNETDARNAYLEAKKIYHKI